MAGVTFCLSSSLGASSCPLDFAPLPRWRNFVFACPMSAHFSRVSNRNLMKKIMYSGSGRRSSIVAAAEVPDFLPAAWYLLFPFCLHFFSTVWHFIFSSTHSSCFSDVYTCVSHIVFSAFCDPSCFRKDNYTLTHCVVVHSLTIQAALS